MNWAATLNDPLAEEQALRELTAKPKVSVDSSSRDVVISADREIHGVHVKWREGGVTVDIDFRGESA